MNYLIRLLILGALILAGCRASAADIEPEPDIESHYDNGLPKFDRLSDAIEYAVQEENLTEYRGAVFGSEYYEVALPSRAVSNNWVIACFYGALFREFGEDAYAELALLLTNEHEFVQVGAYSVLNSAMNAHGLKRHVRQSDQERLEIRNQFLAILESEGE